MVGSLLGTEVQRVEDPDLLRGRGTYIGNLAVEGMLHVGFVRSHVAHAEIAGIDPNVFQDAGALLITGAPRADAFFAPVVMRFETYDVKLPPVAQAYCEAVQALAAVREWVEAARRETEFVAADEPYSKG